MALGGWFYDFSGEVGQFSDHSWAAIFGMKIRPPYGFVLFERFFRC